MPCIGQVFITEGDRSSFISRAVAWATGSWATHAFIVTDLDTLTEADFPLVRNASLKERLNKLERSDRAWVALDLPGINISRRCRVARKAQSYVGRFYDVGQLFVYAINKLYNMVFRGHREGSFWRDGVGTLVCSRLVTAAYYSGIGVNLFPDDLLAQHYPNGHSRLDNMRNGYVVPVDFLKSALTVVDFQPSSRIKTVEDFLVKW